MGEGLESQTFASFGGVKLPRAPSKEFFGTGSKSLPLDRQGSKDCLAKHGMHELFAEGLESKSFASYGGMKLQTHEEEEKNNSESEKLSRKKGKSVKREES